MDAWYDIAVDELILLLFQDVVMRRISTFGPHPIRDEFLLRLDRAHTLEEAALAIHDAAAVLGWLGEALVVEPGEPFVRRALEGTVPRMLAMQDRLELVVEAAADKVAARKVIVAHEILRRCLALGLHAATHGTSSPHTTLSPAAPMVKYVSDVALLVAAIEHLAPQRASLVSGLAQRALEAARMLHHAAREMGIDLTPWADAPPATRAKRILEAARVFWSSLDAEQRGVVEAAWTERVELMQRESLVSP